MSVTAAKGFRASGVTAGLKASGTRDVALVVNDGPSHNAAAVFTRNRVQAACIPWSKQVLADGRVDAVVLNSGGANAFTGPQGFLDVHSAAEKVAAAAGVSAGDVVVCQTGIIGVLLPMDKFLPGIEPAAAGLSGEGGNDAADAIRTTDSVSKTSVHHDVAGWTIGGMAKGAGMLAPSLATMLVVLTTDVDLDVATLDRALRRATSITFERVDSDGCMSTNDTVLLMASGASGISPDEKQFSEALDEVCLSLALQLLADAEGASKEIRIDVTNAATKEDALEVARAVARNSLLKCAIAGNDPNWGRVIAAVGTTGAAFVPEQIDIAFNDVWLHRDGAPAADPASVDLSGRDVRIVVNLHAGAQAAWIWTNDLTEAYVHENSAYST